MSTNIDSRPQKQQVSALEQPFPFQAFEVAKCFGQDVVATMSTRYLTQVDENLTDRTMRENLYLIPTADHP